MQVTIESIATNTERHIVSDWLSCYVTLNTLSKLTNCLKIDSHLHTCYVSLQFIYYLGVTTLPYISSQLKNILSIKLNAKKLYNVYVPPVCVPKPKRCELNSTPSFVSTTLKQAKQRG